MTEASIWLPKGEPGDKGPTGDPGPQGPPGEQGPPGPGMNDFLLKADAASNDILKGAALIGEGRWNTNLQTVVAALPYYLSLEGLPTGGDDLAAYQALLNKISLAGGGELIMDSEDPLFVSNAVHVPSNLTIRWVKNTYVTLTQASTVGHVFGIFAGSTADEPVENINLFNVRIDGGSLGYNVANPYGENGLAATRAKKIRVFGGHIRNCYEGALRHFGTGGNGVQFEAGIDDALVEGVLIENCTNGLATQGLINAAPPADFRTTKGITYVNNNVYNCEKIIGLYQAISPPSTDPSVVSIRVLNTNAWNSGKGRVGQETDMAPILMDRFANGLIDGVNIYNTDDYGTIHTVVRCVGAQRNNLRNIRLFGSATSLVNHTTPNAGAGFATAAINQNVFEIDCYGTVGTPVVALAAGIAGGTTQNLYKFRTAAISGPNFTSLDSGTFNATNILQITDIATGKTAEGLLELFRAAGGKFATSQTNLHLGTSRFNTMSFSFGSGSDSILADGVLNFLVGGATLRCSMTGTTVRLVIPTFASNAAAITGGLVATDVYKTATGELRIVV